MKKILAISAAVLCLAGCAPKSEEPAAVPDVPTGYYVGATGSLQKIFKFTKAVSFEKAVSLYSARNEYESFQVIIDSNAEVLDDLRLEISDLTGNGTAAKIDKSFIRVKFVGYVPTRKPYYKTSYVGLWPDPLLDADSVSLEAGERAVFWVTVYVPSTAQPGMYKGNVKVRSEQKLLADIPIDLNVWDFVLPKKPHLKTAFDFYEGRIPAFYTRKRGESYDDWKERTNQITEAFYLDMLDYRMAPILKIDPLDSDFQERMARYNDHGISAFGIGKYGGTFGNNWPQAEDARLISLYSRYAQVLRQMDLLEEAYLYTWDEGKIGNPRVQEVTGLIHRADPGLKNMVCYHGLWDPAEDPEWGKDIDIWCFQIASYDARLKQKLEGAGKEIWMYVSGPGDVYPNLAIDFPATDPRILPWMCFKYDIKGFLYWAVNFWTVDPFEDAMNTDWQQNGNGVLFYPGEDGPVASLRAEMFRDGMEDYEYLYMLEEKLGLLKERGLTAANPEIVRKAEQALDFSKLVISLKRYSDKPEELLAKRKEIAGAIIALNTVVGNEAQADTETVEVTEDFTRPISAEDKKSFGEHGQLTFELYRNGVFEVDAEKGIAWQRSDSYRDSAIIRSSQPLPPTYKVAVILGDIDYDLSNIEGLHNDPEYSEGPLNENGLYLLAITDEAPIGPHTNDWWHQHRKVCIDIDNNVWGHGMPHPVFMVYFDSNNDLRSFDGLKQAWVNDWNKAITYEPEAWYKAEIEKTDRQYILRLFDDKGVLLREGTIDRDAVWHGSDQSPDYLAVGDPHENYYQGSVKIKSISLPVVAKRSQ